MTYDIKIIHSIRDILMSKHQTLSVAESVTSGNIQAAISTATQASLFFQGGITVYNAGQKSRHLGVEPIHALQVDSVSDQVARQMALGANRLFMSHYSVAITGYASPMPEKDINELYAYYAVAYDQKIIASKRVGIGMKETAEAQVEYTRFVLTELNNLLLQPSVDE